MFSYFFWKTIRIKFRIKRGVIFIILSLIVSTFNGCKECEDSPTKNESSLSNALGSISITQEGNEGIMTLGPQLQNPYTVINMQTAFYNLKSAGLLSCDSSTFNIRCTHRYIKFMPENEEQEEILLDREDLILFDYH